MKSVIAFIVAILGVVLSVTCCSAALKTITEGIDASREVMTLRGADPSQLSAVIGETLIALASRGLLAIVPAVLLYAALAGFRVRSRWFYSCATLAAVFFLFLPPFATIYGIILLVALRRRKSEFASVSSQPSLPPGNSAAAEAQT